MQPWIVRSALERLLLPSICLICDRSIRSAADPALCPVCRSRFRRVTRPWCERCGEPQLGTLPCRLCVEWPDGLIAVRSLFRLDRPLRRAIHALKYDGFARLGRELGPALGSLELPGLPAGVARIVPVPLSARRLRRRGYNQAEALAGALALAWDTRARADILERIRETRSQTTLTPSERLANVSGAFRVRAGYRAAHPVVLVDDVFTTGATLVAAATALLGAGTEHVYGVTLARAEPRDLIKEKTSWPFVLA